MDFLLNLPFPQNNGLAREDRVQVHWNAGKAYLVHSKKLDNEGKFGFMGRSKVGRSYPEVYGGSKKRVTEDVFKLQNRKTSTITIELELKSTQQVS